MGEGQPELADFGRALETCRNAAGMSQQAVADELGVSRQRVDQWEDGNGEPHHDQVFAMEGLYGIKGGTLSAVLGYLPLDARPVRTVIQAIQADPRLDARDREALEGLYKTLVSR